MTAMTTRGAIDLKLPDFDTASLVGQHNAAVKTFLDTNDISDLRPFEGRTVKDTSGRTYVLETRPNVIRRRRCERRNLRADLSHRSIGEMEMDDKELKREARLQRMYERLGVDDTALRIECGLDDVRCLEAHHIAGRKFDDATVILCRNCHRILSDDQKDHPPLIGDDAKSA